MIFSEFVYKRRLTEFCDNNPASFEYLPSILEDDDLADYYLSGDSLVVDVFNCLSKFEKVFGTDAYTYFSFNELRPYLNDYGRAVLGLSTTPVKNFRSQSLPQLMSGHVNGKYPVFLLMRRNWGDDVYGIYAYKKYGVGITLRGTLEGDNLSLVEWDEDFDDNGYIEGTFSGDRISGVWKSKEKSRPYSFVVQNM